MTLKKQVRQTYYFEFKYCCFSTRSDFHTCVYEYLHDNFFTQCLTCLKQNYKYQIIQYFLKNNVIIIFV